MLSKIVPKQNSSNLSSYHSLVLFSVLNSLYPSFKMELIKPFFSEVMQVFWNHTEEDKKEEFYILKQEERIRFINRIFLDLNVSDTETAIAKLPV